MSVRHDEHAEHVEVLALRPKTVHGALQGGATVRAHGLLVVRGVVSGPLVIDAQGVVIVRGEMSAQVENAGVLSIRGIVRGFPPADGVVFVSAGALFVQDDEVFRVTEDGSFEPVHERPVEKPDIGPTARQFRLLPDGRLLPATNSQAA